MRQNGSQTQKEAGEQSYAHIPILTAAPGPPQPRVTPYLSEVERLEGNPGFREEFPWAPEVIATSETPLGGGTHKRCGTTTTRRTTR